MVVNMAKAFTFDTNAPILKMGAFVIMGANSIMSANLKALKIFAICSFISC
jgi:hypothetical protein